MTPLTVAHKAPLSMVFSGQEYWSGLLFSTPGDIPDDPGVMQGTSAVLAGSFTTQPPGKLKQDYLSKLNPIVFRLKDVIDSEYAAFQS